VKVAFKLPRSASVIERDGIVRLQAYSLAVILDCTVKITLIVSRNAPAVETLGIVRLKAYGLAVILDCTVKVTFGEARVASVDASGASPGNCAVDGRCRAALLVSRSARPSCRTLGVLDPPPLNEVRQILRAEAH
jgi:hypothetical protein